jgi:hypothetical protein
MGILQGFGQAGWQGLIDCRMAQPILEEKRPAAVSAGHLCIWRPWLAILDRLLWV